jgi:hypothetical protein
VAIGVRGGSDEVVEIADLLIDPPARKGWQGIVAIVNELA